MYIQQHCCLPMIGFNQNQTYISTFMHSSLLAIPESIYMHLCTKFIHTRIKNTLTPFSLHQLLQKSPFMPETDSCKNVVSAYSQTVLVLDEVVRRNFNQWNQGLEPEIFKRLEQPMMVRCKGNIARLDINFDKWVTLT